MLNPDSSLTSFQEEGNGENTKSTLILHHHDTVFCVIAIKLLSQLGPYGGFVNAIFNIFRYLKSCFNLLCISVCACLCVQYVLYGGRLRVCVKQSPPSLQYACVTVPALL